ncbi:MAG: hypothetical protein Q4A15_02010 [Prevotellaceae bacterium]|nr:hypothetical protein [Prevotellaceae bacterium]
MTTEEKIKVMQAHIDGEYIEFRIKGEKLWEDCGIPAWNWQEFEYRTKPKLKRPTYRPYKDTDEMIADYKERFKVDVPPYAIPLIWIESEITRLITDYIKWDCYTGNTKWSMLELFEICTYLDGSPIGKLVEE